MPNEDELEDAILSAVDAPVPPNVVERYKADMEKRLAEIERQIPDAEKAKANAAARARELKAERDEINRALKAMVKRTRSK